MAEQFSIKNSNVTNTVDLIYSVKITCNFFL